MPPQTADRLWGELGKAHIVDLNGGVVPTVRQPEDTFLELTIMKDRRSGCSRLLAYK